MFSSASPEFHLHASAGQFLSTPLTRLSRSSSVCANAADLRSARRLHSFRRHVVPCSLSLVLPPWLFARGAGLQLAACPPSPTLHLLPESSFRRCGKHATGVGPLAVPSSWWPQLPGSALHPRFRAAGLPSCDRWPSSGLYTETRRPAQAEPLGSTWPCRWRSECTPAASGTPRGRRCQPSHRRCPASTPTSPPPSFAHSGEHERSSRLFFGLR